MGGSWHKGSRTASLARDAASTAAAVCSAIFLSLNTCTRTLCGKFTARAAALVFAVSLSAFQSWAVIELALSTLSCMPC